MLKNQWKSVQLKKNKTFLLNQISILQFVNFNEQRVYFKINIV